MSDTDSFVNEGGSVEVEREDYNFSPAAGPFDEVEVDRDHAQDDGSSPDDDEVGLTVAPPNRGAYPDRETGKTIVRGEVTYFDQADAERLLGLTRRGKPLFVRTDS